MKHIGSYKSESFPQSRIGTVDMGVASRSKHHISALIELDVTNSRMLLKEKKKQDPNYSFNSWLIKCFSIALEENKQAQGIRKGKKKIIIFDDIDISMMVERDIEGQKIPFPYVIRKTNEKSICEISDEIKKAQQQKIHDEGDYVLGEKKNTFLMKFYFHLPKCLRNFIWKIILKNPFAVKENMGTVMITSVGMMASVNGWLLPKTIHPIAFTIGSFVKKPGVYQNTIQIREYIYVTATVDHDVIDGAPAVRMLSRISKLVESGYGLM